ncbi:MAG TPA: CoA pyrophosphatase [Alphaproteobacteria bacterium]|nr:CoA pyrophosphatase [Alphaproteobacteria bacterium]
MTRDLVIERLKARESCALRLRRGITVSRRGDHDLNSDDMRHPGPLTSAAVLVPLVDRDGGMTVLLTQRTAHLHDHAGQISFPGGRVEPEDKDAEAAALREAFEEVGLAPERVEPLGRLDDYETRTGFLVVPVVGIVKPPFELKPDPFEVADIFEVPLAFFLDKANRRLESRMFKGRERQFYVWPYEERYIWGATASMLVNLSEVLAD